MGIVKRTIELVKANLNDILGKVEDSEKMLNQLMIELREEKRKAHSQVVQCIAAEKKLETQVRDHQEKLAQWQKRAEVAVMRDEDDLAREAITRRNEYALMVDELTRQWEDQHQTAEQLKDLLDQLDRRYKEAEFRKQQLIHQYQAAKAQEKATQTMQKLTSTDHMEEFEKVRSRILDMDATAAANAELSMPAIDRQFAQLESEGVVEHDLIQLKAQLGKNVPALGGANGASNAPALPAAAARPASSAEVIPETLRPQQSPAIEPDEGAATFA